MKDLREKFLKELAELLSAEGFKQLPSDSFVKEDGSIRKKIFVDIITRLDRIAVSLGFRIKNSAIEDIKIQTREKARKDSETILLTDHFLITSNGSNKDILSWRVIKNLDELNTAVVNLKFFMHEIGLPFFERFKTLSDFDKWFNEPVLNGGYNFQTGQNWNDSLSGLIAAKLNSNLRYEEIYNIWMQKMAEKGNETQTIKELETTKHFLDNLPVLKA
jgi:hypothetical protein